jgi:hypothetical protein
MYQIRNICSSDCDLFELFGYSLQVPVPPELDATEHDSSEPNSMEEGASATSRKLNVHPEPIFGSSQNLKALVREASSRNLLDDGDAVLRLPLSQWHTSTCIHLAGFFQLQYIIPKFHGDGSSVQNLVVNRFYT